MKPLIPQLELIRRTSYPNPETIAWHSHATAQLGYIIRGRRHVEFVRQSFDLGPGTCFFVAPGHMHRFVTEAGCEEIAAYVAFSKRSLFFTAHAMSSVNFHQLNDESRVISQANVLLKWLELLLTLAKDPSPSSPLAMQGILQRLCSALLDSEATVLDSREVHYTRWPERNLFQNAIKVMERRHPDPRLTVPEIARSLAVSSPRLFRTFARVAGCGPKRYLQTYRLDRARELIFWDDLSLSQIALRVGFPDIYTFSRVFKRMTGLTASEYRKTVNR